jgi:hypothetical protein
VSAILLALLCCFTAARASAPPHRAWQGVFFNPQIRPDPDFPWLLHYAECRSSVRSALEDLHDTCRINLVDVFVMIPGSLRVPARGNRAGEPLEQWANREFLDNVAQFVDDCSEAGIGAELDLVDNRWIPYTVDSAEHIGGPGKPWWPVADGTPWRASADWYRQVIEYVESHARHPDAVAMWCMMGNYHWGAAEPVLWNDTGRPGIAAYTEQFVKRVWPVFRSAGRRPKASPIMLPIFANNDYWRTKTPMDRLAAFTNLKRWLVDDLKLPPDYWVMSSYPFCDPAPDGFRYMHKIVEILGRKSARRIVSTDLKGTGHESEVRDSIVNGADRRGVEALRWHIAKCEELGFAGWWMWAYQDTPASQSGLRKLDGAWKQDLIAVIPLLPSTRHSVVRSTIIR